MNIEQVFTAVSTERDALSKLLSQARAAYFSARDRDGTKAPDLDAAWEQLTYRWRDLHTVCADGAPNAPHSVKARAEMRATLEAAVRDFGAVQIGDIGRPRNVSPALYIARAVGDFSERRMEMENADAAASPEPVAPLDPSHPAERAKASSFIAHNDARRAGRHHGHGSRRVI